MIVSIWQVYPHSPATELDLPFLQIANLLPNRGKYLKPLDKKCQQILGRIDNQQKSEISQNKCKMKKISEKEIQKIFPVERER